MDQFTQRLVEKAEQRSKALGISSTSKLPLTEYNQDYITSSSSSTKKTSPIKKLNSSNRDKESSLTKSNVSRQIKHSTTNNSSKENVDVALEINITTGPNVQVQVEVEERDIDADGNIIQPITENNNRQNENGTAMIRDTSRNRLQRLGALYSDTENLSSPIHRTEGKFHEDMTNENRSGRVKSKFGKLAALANEINNWEDDTSHPDYRKGPIPKIDSPKKNNQPETKKRTPEPSPRKVTGTTPKKYSAPQPPKQQQVQKQQQQSEPKSILNPRRNNSQNKDTEKLLSTKQLKWDKGVMDALESQGFKKRDSSAGKLVYDYCKTTDDDDTQEKQVVLKTKPAEAVGQQKYTVVKNVDIVDQSQSKKDTKIPTPVKKADNLPKGLVSGRTALFENPKMTKNLNSKAQKDPAEMSLKERMAVFEKNKGPALVPKAAFAMAAPVKGTSSDIFKEPANHKPIITHEKPQPTKVLAYNKAPSVESKANGAGIRNTVAALISSGGSTIAESKISEEVRRQRQQEMDVLLNRFNKPTQNSTSDDENDEDSSEVIDAPTKKTIPTAPPLTPPPAPPMPTSFHNNSKTKQSHVEAQCIINNNKRRSDDSKHVDSVEVRTTLDDVKRIKVNPPKNGGLYPALSDIETIATSESDQDYTTATVSCGSDRGEGEHYFHKNNTHQQHDDVDEDDSYMDSEDADSSNDICNGSLGREIMNVVRRNDNDNRIYKKQVHQHNYGKWEQQQPLETSSEISEAFDDMDEYLNEALEDDEDDNEIEYNNRTPKKGTISSNSFSYEKTPGKHVHYENLTTEDETTDDDYYDKKNNRNNRTPVKSELTVNPSKDVVTLVHTVSFYRRQQQSSVVSSGSTPVRKVIRTNNALPSTSEDSEDTDNTSGYENNNNKLHEKALVQEKVKKLLDEVCKQQQIISQTSQALNLCAATIEFSGSTESVEGERHLLVASHRRQAALDEVQRLRVEGSLRPMGAPQERGCLTVKDITVPLRQDYVRKLSTDAISGHNLVCLLKYNENVIATKTVPTLPGLLAVKFPDVLQINNVYADFKVTLEIYGMTAQREVLPHEIKYHIACGKKGSNKLLTPKGKKGSENRLVMPPVQSPAGPNAVRTPALSHYGFVIFSLREMQRTTWSLNQVSGISPLEGIVHMRVNCELSVSVDHRGFLTMFEDVSGFGAWHRRWCRLNGHMLSYWKYPDDEKKKAPMGSIDLYSCSTQRVNVAPRDVCARLNTILLESQRPSSDDDVESLIIVRKGKITIVRYLLSADTKEEREEWCAHLNKSLTLIRAWGPPK